MKKTFEGPRADCSWGHLSIDGVDEEDFRDAIWDANDRVVANPNLLVRITIETVNRPIVPGSKWRSKSRGLARFVETIWLAGGCTYACPESADILTCPRDEDWYRDNEWVSDPEPKT